MRRLALSSLAVLAFSTAGCGTLSVNLLNPRPNIDLDKSPQTLRVEFGQGVEDQFKIPPQNGLGALNVVQWHQTLENGFINGFGDSFALADHGPSALTLEINEALPALTPAAVSGYYGVVAANAQVTYKARILAGSQIVCRSTGTVESKTAVSNAHQVKDAVRSAVEGMYEVIAKECFEHRPAGPPPVSAPSDSRKL